MNIETEVIVQTLQGFGVPGAVFLVIGYTARKIFFWATPWIEKVAVAYIERQSSMAASMDKLTEACISIQREGLDAVKSLRDDMSDICQARCPMLPQVQPTQQKRNG
jgi:hypothetical protein